MLKWDLLEYTEVWEARGLLNAVTSYVFSLIGLYRLLHPLAGITNRLQGRGVDIIEAYDDVSSVIKDIKSTMKNIDKEFSVIFEQTEQVAAKVETQPSMPRIAKKQVNRDNTEGDSPETYYRRVFAIPFIDKLISELALRFTKLSHSASRLLFLISTVITKVPLDKDTFQKIIEMHGKELPNKDMADIKIEMHRNANGLNVMRNCDEKE